MTIAKEVVYALHQRLKDLSVDATPDQLAYLAKSLEFIAGQSTVLDIVQMTDGKLKELLDSATKHLSDLDTKKNSSLAAISESEKQSLKKMDEKGAANLSLLDTRKDASIANINSKGEEHLQALAQVQRKITIDPKSLPLLLGVLNRKSNCYGHGAFTTELGQWHSSTNNAHYMLDLLAGTHNYNTTYVAFYQSPGLRFLQGKNGTFIYSGLYTRLADGSLVDANYIRDYPFAVLGVIFVRNTTNSNITRTLNFVGSASLSTYYGGAGLFVGTPDNTNENKKEISVITWKNIYNCKSDKIEFSATGSVDIPANKTIAVLFYTSPKLQDHYNTGGHYFYSQFVQWGIYNFRSNFLTTGLEVDVERTLRALQCPGLENTHQIWH